MNAQLSTSEQQLLTGVTLMESRATEIIRESKAIKEEKKITYIDIMEQMEQLDRNSVVSLSTLRRVFRDGSEMKASSFNFEEILLPIYNAMQVLGKTPKAESEYDKELNGYKAVIRVQNEELDRLLELKEHLDERVEFLIEQIKLKDRRLDEKDEMIKKLMDKCL